MEINGFEIDKENQYNLPLGKKTFTCPLCSATRKKKTDKCLSIDWAKGLAVCHHCGELLQIHTFKKKAEVKVYKRPEWKNNTELSNNLVKWFEGRGISQFTLRRLQVSEGREWMPQTGKEENTIQFNYFRSGELINIKYRDGRKNFKMVKDAEKIPYNLDNITASNEVIIVEGEMDVLSVVEAGRFDCVSTPNGSTTKSVNLEWLDNSIDYFDNKKKIIMALDNDEPGQNVQKEIIRRLGAERCLLVDLSPYKDFNEVLTHEGVESVKKRILEAKEYPLENVETIADFESELEDYFDNGDKAGYKIGLDSFDCNFSTYTSQYIVVTGIPSHGKSDFVDQMCVGYNLLYGWKIAYASPENKPNKHHGRKIFRKIAGYEPQSKNEFSNPKSMKVREHMRENFYFMEFEKSYELDSVLEKAKELIVRKGVRCIVLDPFNKVRLKSANRSDINEYTNQYLNKIDEFCKRWDVLVIIVAHPVKMNKVNGITPIPDFYSIKGGGEWYDMSYHGLVVHRDFDRGLVQVGILKVKFDNLGKNQSTTWFSWNANNGRYTEVTGDAADPAGDYVAHWDDRYYLEEDTTQNTIDYYEKDERSFDEVAAAFEGEAPSEIPF